MTKNEFVESEMMQQLYAANFELYDDDDDSNEEYEFLCNLGEITIRVNYSSEKFSIYYSIPYYDIKDSDYTAIDDVYQESEICENLHCDIKKYWLSQELSFSFRRHPVDTPDDSCGMCPGYAEWVGYFNVDISQLVQFANVFISVLDKIEEMVANKMMKISGIMKDVLPYIGYHCIENEYRNDYLDTVLTLSNKAYLEKLNLKFIKKAAIYLGVENILIKIDNTVYAIKKCCLEGYERLNEIIYWGKNNELYVDDNGYLYFVNMLFCLRTTPQKNPDIYQDIECMHFQQKWESIIGFVSDKYRNSSSGKLDFTKVTPENFEQICFEYLVSEGYENVNRIGSTNASDGGKDIVAYEILSSKIGTEKRKLLIQCKHSKKTLSRQSIGEIHTLLRENEAHVYILICSNDISPQTIERLEKQKGNGLSIQYWGVTEFSARLSRYPEIIRKYWLGSGLI